MRRKDREIVESDKIIGIIENCSVMRVGFCENNRPYIVPMNYGYEYINDKLTIYFHCACKGKKLDIISVNNFVCFEADENTGIEKGLNACSYTMKYVSVMGEGRIYICENAEEKQKGMALLMKHYVKDITFTFENVSLSELCILKLEVDSLCAKSNM